MTVQNAVAGTRNPERRGGVGGAKQVYNELPSYQYTGTVSVSNVNNNSTWRVLLEMNCCSFILKEVEGMKRRCRLEVVLAVFTVRRKIRPLPFRRPVICLREKERKYEIRRDFKSKK